MKLTINSLIIAAGLLISISGCKKETPVFNDQNINTAKTETNINSGRPERLVGMLTGKIISSGEYTLLLYHSEFISEDYTVAPKSGYFTFKDLNAGGYILKITSLNYDMPEKFIKVFIVGGEVNNLGTIVF